MNPQKEFLKGCMSIFIPIAIAVIFSISATRCNKSKPKPSTTTQSDIIYTVFQGEYDRFINKGGLLPLPDSLRNKDHITEKEYKILPTSIFYLYESDTLRVRSDYELEECYIIFEGCTPDTLDFHYDQFWYYTCISNHNTIYSTLDKIIFVFSEPTQGKTTLTISKEEFEVEFSHLVPYLKLKKNK